MTGFSDIHAHLIYGVDDGAKTIADMEAMIDAAHSDGIAFLFATPHITPGLQQFDEQTYRSRLEEARQYCFRQHYEMAIHAGAEILYTPALQQYVVDRPLPTLADSEFILLEFVPDVDLREMKSALEQLERLGYISILAHMERYGCLHHGENARRVKESYNVRYQVNANSLRSSRGFFRNYRIRNWIQNGLIDFVASDAHDVYQRPFRMSQAYEYLKQGFGRKLADHLTGLS